MSPSMTTTALASLRTENSGERVANAAYRFQRPRRMSLYASGTPQRYNDVLSTASAFVGAPGVDSFEADGLEAGAEPSWL